MSELSKFRCEACNASTPKLTSEETEELLKQLNGWWIVDGHHLYKRWKYKDFAKPLESVNAIGAVAEEEGHHPDIKFSWGYVEITIYTHSIDGLSKNDFILAAKIDQIK